MKSGPEIVKAGLRSFFESAADDIEKMVENLKLGKVSKGNQVTEVQHIWHIPLPWLLQMISQTLGRKYSERVTICCLSLLKQVKGVSQNINYTTIALLPVLTSLFDHIAQHQFGDDVICECFLYRYRFWFYMPLIYSSILTLPDLSLLLAYSGWSTDVMLPHHV